jgi:predicted RNA-binding protein with PIN domain
MPYLIDGHNLIPHIPGLTLQDLDDELELIQLLQAFSQATGKRTEVYFDNAAPGQAGRRAFGPVTAFFVSKGRTADTAIKNRLKKLGRSAPNWTVVSADREVIAAARGARAKTSTSGEFARLMVSESISGESEKEAESELSEAEIETWLRLFNDKKEG